MSSTAKSRNFAASCKVLSWVRFRRFTPMQLFPQHDNQCMRERFSKFKKYGSFLPGQSFALKYELKGVFRVTELRELPGRHDLQHRMFLGGEEDRSSCQTEAERNSLKDPNPLHKILKKYAIQVVCTSSLRRPASLATPRPA